MVVLSKTALLFIDLNLYIITLFLEEDKLLLSGLTQHGANINNNFSDTRNNSRRSSPSLAKPPTLGSRYLSDHNWYSTVIRSVLLRR